MGFIWNVTWKIALALTAFYLYTPMPSGISNPMKVTFLNAAARTGKHMATFIEYMEWGTEIGVTRYLFERAQRRDKEDTADEVRSYDTKIANVPVRVYEPSTADSARLPAIIYLHGGGMVMGSIDSYDETTRFLATTLKIKIISVGYRLAPENPFPIPLQDCFIVTKTILQRPWNYNIDANNIAVAGDSAGGNLAAVVAQKLHLLSRAEEIPKLKFQGLIYPVLQSLDFNLPSYLQNHRVLYGSHDRKTAIGFRLNYALGSVDPKNAEIVLGGELLRHVETTDKAYVLSYINASHVPQKFKQRESKVNTSYSDEGHPIPQKLFKTFINPTFMPLMRKDLQGLADTYIMTCEFDVLRDDGILYARRLKKAGVEVKWDHIESGFHGIFSLGESYEAGKEAREKFIAYAKKKFEL
ncbi:arylacetamide deacetylase-like [Glandiceps talaboti]